LALNSDGIPAPRTAKWSSSTINGNRARGTGILNNELYAGRLVWNRLTYLKDPDTCRRRSRQNDERQVTHIDVPHLRIVPPDLWEAVRARQSNLDRRSPAAPSSDPAPFWSKQRPRYLFSGLMRCGTCGGGFSKISAAHFGCSTARNKGPTACANLLTIRRDVLEDTVFGALRERLMDPDVFAAFAAEFTAEWNCLQAASAGEQEARQAELERVRRQMERLVDAIADGTPVAMVRDRLTELDVRRLTLETKLNTAVAPAPRLHPKLAEVYRQRVAALGEALAAEDAAETRELVRGLVETITLVPEAGTLRIDVRGELCAILRLAEGARNKKRPGEDAEALVAQIKMVAGARNRRSHHSTVPI
jgi:site-specific DNA recombinase